MSMKEAMSENMKLHWQKCEQIATYLECDKEQIHRAWHHLNSVNSVPGLIERLLKQEGKEEALPLIPEPSIQAVRRKRTKRKTTTKGGDLNIAIWYIDKVGSYERAQKLLNAAHAALKELE